MSSYENIVVHLSFGIAVFLQVCVVDIIMKPILTAVN